ncbi:hypothetical protein ATANTOWER_011666, partial [Ataeniobius toweri]|nr:hypothetical protein [Ataeniobius toweri]
IAISDELDQQFLGYNSVLRPRVVGEWVGRDDDDADPLAAEMLHPPFPRAKTKVCWSGENSPARSGHGQQEGGFQGEPPEIHPRNGLKRERLKGRKHQRQIPRRGHRAPGWTQAPGTLQEQRDIPMPANRATTKPDMPMGNGCHIHLQKWKGIASNPATPEGRTANGKQDSE